MPKYSRGVLRLLAVLALVVAVQSLAGYAVRATCFGRNYSRCVQQCNDVRRACDDRCSSDCRDLFPNDKTQRDACIAACKTICGNESDDCKLVCQQNKCESPEEP
jgi:hypothetical protein